MKKKKKVIGNLSNKLFYTLIVIGVLIFGGVGVFAWTAGGTGNPGHSIQDIAAPSTCDSGEYLRYSTSGSTCEDAEGVSVPCWTCASPAGGGTTLPTCSNGQIAIKTSTGWTCSPSCGSDQVLKKIPTSEEWACSDFNDHEGVIAVYKVTAIGCYDKTNWFLDGVVDGTGTGIEHIISLSPTCKTFRPSGYDSWPNCGGTFGYGQQTCNNELIGYLVTS